MSLQNIAEEYFSQINPMASRIYTDLNETKLAYEDLWPTLSEDEKKLLLTESIIKPEVVLKYSSNQLPRKTKEEQYAVKIVLDDLCSYRDEHSGPFNFRTQSQRNLHIFDNKNLMSKSIESTKSVLKPKLKLTSENPPEAKRKPDLSRKNQPGNLYEQHQHQKEEGYSTLPKTGLDFLDNW